MNMKKIKFLLPALLLIIAIVGFTVTNVFTKTIKINANFTKVIDEINKPQIIQKWFSPFVGLDSSAVQLNDTLITTSSNGVLEIKQQSYVDYLYKYNLNNYNKKVLLSANADTSVNHTIVTFKYDATLFDELFSYSKGKKLINESVSNLQKLNTDTKLLYGYEIKEETVTDTTFIFSKLIVAADNVTNGLQILFEKIDKFSASINAQKTEARIF